MKITFVSNYINHHQIPLSNELYNSIGEDYKFIQIYDMEEDRVKMGWLNEINNTPYLIKYTENKKKCDALILESDIVIYGGVEDEQYIQPRLQQGKVTIRYTERLYKEGVWKAISPRGLIRKYKDHTRYKNKEVYLLCAGGYVAYDFSIVRAYPDKMYKFGYFPQTLCYDEGELFNCKGSEIPRLLWAGRFLDWKHPEMVLELAKYFKENSVKVKIDMIGGGELEDTLKQKAKEFKVEDIIGFLGYLSPSDVREEMKKADIFLFTSNYYEGWGAVANEAMNAGCAVICSHAVGAAPFLIEDKVNARIYKSGDRNEFFSIANELVNDTEQVRKLGREAYKTIVREWNAENVAKRLIRFCEGLIKGEKIEFTSGPMSKAEVIKERNMYRYLKNNK